MCGVLQRCCAGCTPSCGCTLTRLQWHCAGWCLKVILLTTHAHPLLQHPGTCPSAFMLTPLCCVDMETVPEERLCHACDFIWGLALGLRLGGRGG